MSEYVISANNSVKIVFFQPCFLYEPSIDVICAHSVNKVFKFGCVTFIVIDDVAIAVTCSTPESMDILGIYLADVHGSGRRGILDVGAGDGKGMVRWVICHGWR